MKFITGKILQLPGDCLVIILGTTSAVEYLHDRNIVHCGLRAKNVLIDQDFRPKVRNIENNTKTKSYQSEDVRHWSIELFEKVLLKFNFSKLR